MESKNSTDLFAPNETMSTGVEEPVEAAKEFYHEGSYSMIFDHIESLLQFSLRMADER